MEVENDLMEQVEVKMYDQSVKQHMYSEEKDNLLVFLEEFIKKHIGQKGQDNAAFSELCEESQQNVNDVLRHLGLHYEETF